MSQNHFDTTAAPAAVPDVSETGYGVSAMEEASGDASPFHGVADSVVDAFIDKLAAKANRDGGQLRVRSQADIDRIAQELYENLNTAFSHTFEVRAERMVIHGEARRDAFHRLLVGEFAFLLPCHGGLALNQNGFSRRLLPGFLTAVRMMLGPDYMTGVAMLCDGISDQIATDDPEARWEAFRRSDDAQGVLFDTLMALSGYFKAPQKRLAWFADIVNARLTRPIDLGREENSHNWRLTVGGATEIWFALFSLLRMANEDPLMHDVLVSRHGERNVARALSVVKELSWFRANVVG